MDAKFTIPDTCLVVLVGVSGAGKTTFARQRFRPSEIVSSDRCRFMVADDENDQDATPAAFEVLHTIVNWRLAGNRFTVVDATNLEPAARASLAELSRRHHVPRVAIVVDVPAAVCRDRRAWRTDRNLPGEALGTQLELLARARLDLPEEGFDQVITLVDVEQVERVGIERARRRSDRRDLSGPFDVIGDVHGCLDELTALLGALGYTVAPDRSGAAHPDGRMAVFLGDLVDRGPDPVGVLGLVMGMARAGTALCVPGNHEANLVRALRHGDNAARGAGSWPAPFRADVQQFIEGLGTHLLLDEGRLVLAHAGLPEALHGRASDEVDRVALHGDLTGEVDADGRALRYPWAVDYRGAAQVVYGHTPVAQPTWVNNTICIDTGCVYGGTLTALSYPENTLTSVPSGVTVPHGHRLGCGSGVS